LPDPSVNLFGTWYNKKELAPAADPSLRAALAAKQSRATSTVLHPWIASSPSGSSQ
jgi:hypothetical protein